MGCINSIVTDLSVSLELKHLKHTYCGKNANEGVNVGRWDKQRWQGKKVDGGPSGKESSRDGST
jgi:hypothetical protein